MTFVLMAIGATLTLVASNMHSLSLYTVGFIVLCVLSGIGNGSTYKMIPAIFRTKAEVAIANGALGGRGRVISRPVPAWRLRSRAGASLGCAPPRCS
jgi:nitrate/nitrite transporter NarK